MNPIRTLPANLALVAGFNQPLPAQNTYSDIPPGCGGWVSGFAQHSSGRLYGCGDIFGLYRSDDFGASWKFLQGSPTDPGLSSFVQSVTVHRLDANRVAFMTAAPTGLASFRTANGLDINGSQDHLTTWAANSSATESTPVSIDANYERVTITDSVSVSAPAKRFVRVRVTTI